MTRGDAACLFALLVGCTAPGPLHPRDPGPPSDAVVLSYEVAFRDGDLDVEARFNADLDEEHELSGPRSGQVESLVRTSRGLSYRIHLQALCEEGDRGMFRAGPVLFASASRWLVRPARLPPGRVRVHVTVAPPMRFVTGMTPASSGEPDTYEAPTHLIDVMTYSAFGPFREDAITLGASTIVLATPETGLEVQPEVLRRWAEQATRGVADYFGRFPLPRAVIFVLPVEGSRIVFGSALGNAGAAVQVMVGERTPPEKFERDWILTHETVHLGFPNLGDDHRWLEEGLATYLEPLIRTQQGIHTEAELWKELRGGFAQGVLGSHERGYEDSQSWAHVYWGGAFFFFLADLEIRARTKNTKGLADALVGVLDDGGDIRTSRRVDRIFEVGDRATGVEVLRPLYENLGRSNAKAVDLPRLLEDLGVVGPEEKVELDDRASHAWLRRAILGRPR